MKIVWVLLQTTRELDLIYVFEPLIESLGTGQLRLKKSFCLLTSECDCLRNNFNNATQIQTRIQDFFVGVCVSQEPGPTN